MKTKLFLSISPILFFMLTLAPNTFAQDETNMVDEPYLEIGRGHVSDVTSLAFSPDGNTLASGSEDYMICLWDVNTTKLLKTLTEHTGGINSVAFSPDGHTLASGSYDKTIRLWDANTGQLLKTLTSSSVVLSVAFHPDGHTLASGIDDGTIPLWDANTGELLKTLKGHTDFGGRTGAVNSVVFSPDGHTLASGSADHTIRLWDANTGELLRTLTGHTGAVNSVVFSPDGDTIASGSYDKTIRLWDANTRRFLRAIAWTAEVLSVAFSPDGNTITNGPLFWDTNTGEPIPNLTRSHLDSRTVVAFSPDGNTTAVNARSGPNLSGIDLWNPNIGERVRWLFGSMSVGIVAFHPDGNTILSGSVDFYGRVRLIRLWDPNTGEQKASMENDFFRTSPGSSFVFSPDGSTCASVMGDYRNTLIHLWNINTGESLKELEGHTDRVNSMAFSWDGQTLLSGGDDRTIRLWDPNTGELLITLTAHTIGVWAVAFHPDGNTIMSAAENTILLWNPDTGELLKTIPLKTADRVRVRSYVFSPDGQTLAINTTPRDAWGSTTIIFLYDTNTGELLTEIVSEGDIREVVFSPDGQRFASRFPDRSHGGYGFRLWDVNTGEVLQTITGHKTGAVNDIAFSPDGQTLVSGGQDGMIRLWHVRTAEFQEVVPILGDVNRDGQVNILDLVVVASRFGQPVPEEGDPADVNEDGVINIQDLVKVAGAFGTEAAAPLALNQHLGFVPARAEVQQWLTEARQANLTDAVSQRGIRFLEQLLAALTPQETALLPNYPNPFNPETWIPYQLAAPADVALTIYAVDGTVVRTLALGHQPVGIYQDKSRAAYWDGRNAQGEPVASGVYFYRLTAGEFTATRKMLIRK